MNPRWEAFLLKFLELSKVGRIVDEEDVEASREERLGERSRDDTCTFLKFHSVYKGTHTPSRTHSATLRWSISMSPLSGRGREESRGSTYPLG
jgi:hypothetical protein